jgi:hypothetical protein
MAINFEIYSNANATSKTITVDFFSDVLADPYDTPIDDNVYYMKFTTSARDTDNLAFTPRIARSLDSLVLNREKQRYSNVASDYSNISALVSDYIYDYINGHDAGLYATSVTEKAPMKFS